MFNSAVLKKILAVGLTVVTVMSAVACNKKDETAKEKEDNKIYTYNTYVRKGEDPMDTVKKYTEMGFVDVQILSDGSWIWNYEMAESITDVTSSYADKEKWGISSEETGRVWQIKLNQNATFEEGTPITADTYIQSMGIVLMSENKEDTERFIDGTKHSTALVGAAGYADNTKAGEDIIDTLKKCGYKTAEAAVGAGVAADHIWMDVTNAFGITCDTENGLIYYQDTEKELIDVRGALGEAGKKVTAKQLYDNLFAAGCKYEDYAAEYLYAPTGEQYAQVSLDTVGLVKVDDYTLYYITVDSVSSFEMYQALRENWITYDATKLKENVAKADEAESGNIYVSYGPYKLLAYRDKEVKLTRNEKWYGYTDDKHNKQYQTTDIVIKVLSTQAEIIQLYDSGKLDYVELSKEYMAKYATSEYLHVRDTEYVYRWVFATELDNLIALEVAAGDGANKRVLYYDDFRKAMSLAIDRAAICQISGANYNEANYLINHAYYTDIANDHESVYRDTAIEVSGDVKYYDIEKAKELFQSVYTQAKLNKNYTDGQKIQINCVVGDYDELTDADKAEEKALNDMLAKATEGTGFQGMINITYQCGVSDRYTACAYGEIEMIKSAWGGDIYDPFALIRCYTDDEYVGIVQESCGWDPTTEKVIITYDFDGNGEADTVAKTFLEWTKEIQKGGTYGNNVGAKTHILACLEQGVINAYQCIPWGTSTVWTLSSEKIKYGVDAYNPIYEYGGVRHITYNYDDKAWKAHLKEK